MPQKSDTRASARASRNSCGGSFRDFPGPLAIQAQFLIAAHNFRPEIATMIAALAFGGGACNG